ncbi:MAG: hypothetical protein ABI806_03350 [Candidatus Solibacter sp.]
MLLLREKALALTCTPLGAVKVRMLPLVPVLAVLPVRSNVVGTQSTGGVTVMMQLLVVVVACTPGVESVTLTVKENGPPVVGVPVIAPVVGLSVRPAGRAPEAIANVYGAVPPVTVIAELYGAPTVPVVAETHSAVIVGGAMVIEQPELRDTACPPVESVAVTVKLKVPDAVGVPEMEPLAGLSVKEVG